MSELDNGSHRRYNILLGEWIVVCKDRLNRPWKGVTEAQPTSAKQSEDCVNYLAPGGIRANGIKTPNYSGTFVFENDFPVFSRKETGTHPEAPIEEEDGLFIQQKTYGWYSVHSF